MALFYMMNNFSSIENERRDRGTYSTKRTLYAKGSLEYRLDLISLRVSKNIIK